MWFRGDLNEYIILFIYREGYIVLRGLYRFQYKRPGRLLYTLKEITPFVEERSGHVRLREDLELLQWPMIERLEYNK